MRYICMAIEKRAHIVEYLRRHIPGLEVMWDRSGNAGAAWVSVMRSLGTDAGVVVEDDIVIAKGFCSKIETAVNVRPSDLIQFHSRTKEDLIVGSRYRAGASFYNNQTIYFPAGMAAALVKFSETSARWENDPSGYDRVMADYMHENKIRYWNHVPSLSDHLPVTSAIDPRRSKHRRSTTFQDPETEGLPVPVLPPNPPRRSGIRTK